MMCTYQPYYYGTCRISRDGTMLVLHDVLLIAVLFTQEARSETQNAIG